MNRRIHFTSRACWRALLMLVGTALAAALTACASSSGSRRDDAQAREHAREFAAAGYSSVEHDAVTTTVFAWHVSGQAVRVVLSRPVRSDPAPLVIYLPGLGESSDAGGKWRAAWSAAGYVVMSVQVLDDDVTAWSSELAREADFKGLARQRYSDAVMVQRVKGLDDLLIEAARRSSAGDSAWSRIDWSRTAIAGFDLGAYTAMTVAGEHGPGEAPIVLASGRVTLRAAIALSPYASIAAGSLETRYRDIRLPVMSVTSDEDRDPMGIVSGAALRRAPFAHMEPRDKFLLALQGMTHDGLGGNADKEPKASAGRSRPSSTSADRQGGDDTGQRRRGGGKRAATGEREPGGDDRSVDESAGDARPSPSGMLMRVVAAQDISTAFLDAYVKDDPLARQWLTAVAARWLGPTGELQRK